MVIDLCVVVEHSHDAASIRFVKWRAHVIRAGWAYGRCCHEIRVNWRGFKALTKKELARLVAAELTA